MENLISVLAIIGLILAVRKALPSKREKTLLDPVSQPVYVNPETEDGPQDEPQYKPARLEEQSQKVIPRSRMIQTEKELTIKEDKAARKVYEEEIPINLQSSMSVAKKGKHAKASPFQHLTKEQLREGIILAEVLSERPRALNPHPAASRYRHLKS